MSPDATMPAVADQDDLNVALMETVERWGGERGSSLSQSSPLKVNWEITSATGELLGIRIASEFEQAAKGPVVRSASLYADLVNHTFVRSPEFLTKGSLGRATSYLTRAIADSREFSPGASRGLRPSASLFSDLVPQSDGSIVVVLPAGTVTTEQRGPLAIRISEKAANPLLSKHGKTVQRQAKSGAALVDLPAPPLPPPGTELPPPTPGTQLPPPTVDCAAVACIALTFDDGPSDLTPLLLDRLDAAGVKSTFFVIGKSAAARPDIIANAVQRGHEVAGHSWGHGNLTKMSPEEAALDSQQTADVITAATGVAPLYFRPPYGAVNGTVLAATGLPAILWNVDTEDWKNRDIGQTTERAMAGAHHGSIILFHDIRETTVDAIPNIVAQLQVSGFHLVTVGTLMANQGVAPGGIFSYRK